MIGAVEVVDFSGLFVAEAGAAAALAGLLFVAMSINVREILSYAWLPNRAAETVTILVGALVVACAALMPGLSEAGLGLVLLVVSALTWTAVVVMQLVSAPPGIEGQAGRHWGLRRVLLGQAATLPAVVGSVVLLAGSASGLYLVAAGILAAFVVSVTNAWVLMVEILR